MMDRYSSFYVVHVVACRCMSLYVVVCRLYCCLPYMPPYHTPHTPHTPHTFHISTSLYTQWDKDQRHGFGRFNSNETGSYYEGEWVDGIKEGSGTIYLSNNDSFTGRWRQGKIDGAVVYKFSDKSPWCDPEY